MAVGPVILTIHPEPAKQGVYIDRGKYEAMRHTILANLKRYGRLTFKQLGDLVANELHETFTSSVQWYYTTVKLDLEARGELKRVPNSRPQLIELA
jgi:hypothetical protein